MRRILGICALGLASCADAGSDGSPAVEDAENAQAKSEAESASSKVQVIAEPTNTAEELAFAATDVCRRVVSRDDNTTDASRIASLEAKGYTSHTAKMRSQLGPAFASTEFFRKNAHDSHFLVTWGEGMSTCVVLLTDDSAAPSFEELRGAFEARHWERSGVVGTGGQPPAQAFLSRDSQGAILAVFREEPETDPTVRLGIDVSYVSN